VHFSALNAGNRTNSTNKYKAKTPGERIVTLFPKLYFIHFVAIAQDLSVMMILPGNKSMQIHLPLSAAELAAGRWLAAGKSGKRMKAEFRQKQQLRRCQYRQTGEKGVR
jgi:hypothetical protein